MSDQKTPGRQGLARGTRLNGIYEIEEPIAEGGMGEVYRAHNIQTGDPVAIKLVLAEHSGNEDAMALFRREASMLHTLHHEAIVRYYVFTVDPDLGRAYLAMEYVHGPSLSDMLETGPLPIGAVRLLQVRLAGGLAAAHQRGVVHRDLSPDNVILPDGDVRQAKIIDFGIARSTRPGSGTLIGGAFAGKYNWVSPEQIGLYSHEIDAKSDIYSLGLLLAAALLGHPIDMDGSQADVVEKRRRLPDLSGIDASMLPLLTAMLQPDPEDRPPSMAAVARWGLEETIAPWATAPLPAAALSSAERRERTPAPSVAVRSAAPEIAVPRRPSAQPPARSGRGALAAGIAAVALLAAAGGGAFYLGLVPDLRGGSGGPPLVLAPPEPTVEARLRDTPPSAPVEPPADDAPEVAPAVVSPVETQQAVAPPGPPIQPSPPPQTSEPAVSAPDASPRVAAAPPPPDRPPATASSEGSKPVELQPVEEPSGDPASAPPTETTVPGPTAEPAPSSGARPTQMAAKDIVDTLMGSIPRFSPPQPDAAGSSSGPSPTPGQPEIVAVPKPPPVPPTIAETPSPPAATPDVPEPGPEQLALAEPPSDPGPRRNRPPAYPTERIAPAAAEVGRSYVATLPRFVDPDGDPVAVTVDGMLPPGLSVLWRPDGSVQISGIATLVGSFPFRVIARDPDGATAAVGVAFKVASTGASPIQILPPGSEPPSVAVTPVPEADAAASPEAPSAVEAAAPTVVAPPPEPAAPPQVVAPPPENDSPPPVVVLPPTTATPSPAPEPPPAPADEPLILAAPQPQGVAPQPSPVPPEPPVASPQTPVQDVEVALAPAPPVEPPPTGTPLPATTPVVPSDLTLMKYLDAFDGGACFFARPMLADAGAARIEGFGASIEGFERLESTFISDFRVEPQIDVRMVDAGQCPAVEFMQSLGPADADQPLIHLDRFEVGPGRPLSGRIDGLTNGVLTVLLVSNDGTVMRLDGLLKPQPGGAGFEIPMQADDASRNVPQLLMAVLTERPLVSLPDSGRSDQVFAALAAEVRQSGLQVALDAEMFKVGD